MAMVQPSSSEAVSGANRFVIISGLSGGGKSIALHALEDAGYYCVDNLPVGLLLNFVAYLSEHPLPQFQHVAVGIDARNHELSIAELPATLESLRKREVDAELVFVDASDEALLQRFSETRRRHPLSSDETPLAEAIESERRLLDSISSLADIRIDTTRFNVHELRNTVRDLITKRREGTLALQLSSFGFKHGVPTDADFVFDVRCLPNPYWQASLRDQTGLDTDVVSYLHDQELVQTFLADIVAFLDRWIEKFEAINRSYLTIAFGCTGGRHRSVFIAERVAAHFGEQHKRAVITHREI